MNTQNPFKRDKKKKARKADGKAGRKLLRGRQTDRQTSA